MKRLLLLAAAFSAALLSGCSLLSKVVLPPPDKPEVLIVDGSISVLPEPLRFKTRGATVIVWSLPSGYAFPANGIVFEGEIVSPLPIDAPRREQQETIRVNRAQQEIVDCKPIANNTKFQCLNKNTRPGEYKYTVRVLENGRPLKPLDPHLYNE
jgi:hypothetical protein